MVDSQERHMPLPVFLVSAFIVIYLGFAVDNPPKLSAYLSDVLWAVLYTYALKEEYRRSVRENTGEAS
ncbi:hypothetical protein [Thermococcus sp.]|uniref:hypothetical protein n=1 Tax=Thermococcus sp. TaxID=35749 RepID=UPI0025DD9CCE|nr:hypothetical protein [Thermococcus sp.]